MSIACISPISGRVVLRPLSDGSGSLLGVLQLPTHFPIAESAGYLLFLDSSGLKVWNPPFDAGPPPEIDGWGINASLKNCNWPAFAELPELMMVRFIAAFPEQNVWAVYGASRRLTVQSESPHATHIWFDVNDQGRFREIAAPAEGNGYSCAQLLTALCVWPNAEGTLHCLAQLPSRWRPVYLRQRELATLVGDGIISEQEYSQRVSRDPELRHIGPLRLEPEYARFLARLGAENGPVAFGPMTAEQKKSREARAQRICQEIEGIERPDSSVTPPPAIG
jgi:hypothetical protein